MHIEMSCLFRMEGLPSMLTLWNTHKEGKPAPAKQSKKVKVQRRKTGSNITARIRATAREKARYAALRAALKELELAVPKHPGEASLGWEATIRRAIQYIKCMKELVSVVPVSQ